MGTTEELLQELIDLKKTQLRRDKTRRTLHFVFIILPVSLLVLISIWATVILVQRSRNFIEDLPEKIQENIENGVENNAGAILQNLQEQFN